MVKIGIVGIGKVGATLAFATLMAGLVEEMVLVDTDVRRVEGEALDLLHGTSFTRHTRIRVGDYGDLNNSKIVVITAGVAQKLGESRFDLMERNVRVIKNIVIKIAKYAPNSILLMVTNPVDVLTYVAWKVSRFPFNRVMGSGTVLDTARFRVLIARHCRVSPKSVHAYIIGEHGDSELAVWSKAVIGGVPIKDMCNTCSRKDCSSNALENIFEKTRKAAYEIIERKGATQYAVALAVVDIMKAIIEDEKRVLTVSTLVDTGGKEIFLSLPAVVGSSGVEKVLKLKLSEDEEEALKESMKVISENIEKAERVLKV